MNNILADRALVELIERPEDVLPPLLRKHYQ